MRHCQQRINPKESKCHIYMSCIVRRWGRGGLGNRYKFAGPDYVASVFVFLGGIIVCQLQELTLSDQTYVTQQLRISLTGLV
jgi:hypothetical protein